MRWIWSVCLVGLAGCESCEDNPVRHLDGRVAEVDAPSTVLDAAASGIDASNPNSTILITVSPPGPSNGDMTTWGGVLQYQVSGDGAALVDGAGITKDIVHDPAGLAFRFQSSEVYVGNRHGNNSADGTAGSISRFTYSQSTHALTKVGDITGNGLAGVHQVTFSPTTGEMFGANVNNGISRFTFDEDGTTTAAGMLATGSATRGVLVAPDGKRLWVSGASNVIRQFDLTTGNELASVTLQTTGNLHYFAFRKGELYVAALGDNKVYRYTVDTNDDLTFKQAIDASQPIGVAFSADGEEMFVTTHYNADVIERYLYRASDDTWQSQGTMNVGSSLGGIVIVPG